MAKTSIYWYVACVIALIIGGALAYWIMPTKEVEVIKEVKVELPVIEVQSVEGVKEVPLDAKATYLDPAVKDFIKEVSKDDDFAYCGRDEYDEDQIKMKSAPKNWEVKIGPDEVTVVFDAKLKYLDKDVDEKCYVEFEVEVFYEEGEKPQVEFDLI